MKKAPILLFDFDPSSGSVELLKAELNAMFESDASIHHEQSDGMGVKEALEQLSAGIVRVVPDLLIVLLSDEAQSSAPSIFPVLLGHKRCPPIVAVPSSDEPSAIDDLYRLGASDYLIPPFRAVDVRPRLRRLLSCHGRRETSITAVKESLGLKQFVGESPALLEQVQKLPQMARCNASVLITGETGTGKEVCARAIHFLSRRANHPFVPLNCGAIPTDLLENELFGHETGAFTSANAPHAGVICEANGGTLFLDEIDSLPLPAQVKLLRFLQDKEYRPLGARKPSKADVRIIAASNTRRDELVNSGKMRQDLFYRLNVLPLHLPPLRQRKEDIPLLARHFVAKYVAETDGQARDIAPAALHKLSLYDWPGNVRELENAIEHAVVLSTSSVIHSDEIHLPIDAEQESKPESFGLLKAKVVAEFERNYLRTVLEQHRGNIGQAARTAQKNRRVFFQLMRKHNIRVERSGLDSSVSAVAKVVIAVDKNIRPSTRL
ncbi:MAG: sigma-54 dependent transcriptional regulator [Verrucomicrobiota bacterium]